MASKTSLTNYTSDPLAAQSALWCDRYALTMAQALFTSGRHNARATFHAFSRKNPFRGGYIVTGGQNIVFEWLERHWKFDAQDIELLRHASEFTPDFLKMLETSKLELSIDAMPEGEIAFPDEPVYRVEGPLWQCLMIEGGLLNALNSQSLFATLASRLVEVAEGAPILEFGVRRAQGLGGLEASRGAWLGGVAATSNMLAEKHYGIPSSGTFAHAYVMAYEDEVQAFRDYASAMPHSGVFLVDTYDTLRGVKNAIEACRKHKVDLKGIRLDSGDLTYLSKQARKLLDDAGFKDAKIIASNDLDEETIDSIHDEGGQIDVWGVGTNLVTAKAQPALGAVYKMGEIEGRDVIKLSDQVGKITIPGRLDVIRYLTPDGKQFSGDTIVRASDGMVRDGKLVQHVRSARRDQSTFGRLFQAGTLAYQPLQPAFCNGKRVAPYETIHEARDRAKLSLSRLDSAHRRLKNPHAYIVGLEQTLSDERNAMISRLRGDK